MANLLPRLALARQSNFRRQTGGAGLIVICLRDNTRGRSDRRYCVLLGFKLRRASGRLVDCSAITQGDRSTSMEPGAMRMTRRQEGRESEREAVRGKTRVSNVWAPRINSAARRQVEGCPRGAKRPSERDEHGIPTVCDPAQAAPLSLQGCPSVSMDHIDEDDKTQDAVEQTKHEYDSVAAQYSKMNRHASAEHVELLLAAMPRGVAEDRRRRDAEDRAGAQGTHQGTRGCWTRRRGREHGRGAKRAREGAAGRAAARRRSRLRRRPRLSGVSRSEI